MLSLIRSRIGSAEKGKSGTSPTMVTAPLDTDADPSHMSGTEHSTRVQDMINNMTPEEHAQVRDTLKREGITWPYSRSPKWAGKLLGQ